MKSPNQTIKIEIDTSSLTADDLEAFRRWENEGGHPSSRPDILASLSLPLPLQNGEIFEVVDSDVIVENGKLHLQAEINVLSHH